MSTNVIHEHGTDHIKVTAAAAHKAGDLVCERGFYGTVAEDNAAGDVITVRLNPTVRFARTPSTLAAGVVVAAPATAQATTLPILAFSPATSGITANATTGWYPFGKTIATGNATTAPIQLFNPNHANVVMP